MKLFLSNLQDCIVDPLIQDFTTFCSDAIIHPADALQDAKQQLGEFSNRFHHRMINSDDTLMRAFTRTHGRCVQGLLQRLGADNALNHEDMVICKHKIYSVLLKIQSHRFELHRENYYLEIAYSGLLSQAAHDARAAFKDYRTNLCHGKLATRAILLIHKCTCSLRVRSMCEPEINSCMLMFLDPTDNDSYVVRLAAGVMNRLKPENKIHDMLFRDLFLAQLVADMRKLVFDHRLNRHMVTNYIDVLGAFMAEDLTSILLFILTLFRLESYVCFLFDALINTSSLTMFESAVRTSVSAEKDCVIKVLRNLRGHNCSVHHTKNFPTLLTKELYLLLTPIINFDQQPHGRPGIRTRRNPGCAYVELCRRFFSTLKIKGVLIIIRLYYNKYMYKSNSMDSFRNMF